MCRIWNLGQVQVAFKNGMFVIIKTHNKKKTLEEKLQLLHDVSIKIEQEKKRKEECIKNKNNESSTKSNLGKQDTDS